MNLTRTQAIAIIRKAELATHRNSDAAITLPSMRLDQQAQHLLRMRYSLASDAANQ
jgi:hypothetical protein